MTDSHGLTLRVYPTGAKTWVLRLCTLGRVTDIKLGNFPEMGLKEARQITRQKRKERGQEPPRGYVFADAFRIWCDQKRGRIVSYENERRMIERHLLRHIKNKQIDEITAPLIVHIVQPLLEADRKVTLKRVIMRCREILDLAVAAGLIKHNPVERLNRIYSPAEVTPMPAIDWQELSSAMSVISYASRRMQVIFLWSLCSMLRPGEVASIKWEWIENDVLTIQAEKMKKRRQHRVPIIPALRYLLDEAKAVSRHPKSGYIFPGAGGSRPMSSQTLAKYLHSTELRGKLVAHGCRSIARSWMADHEVSYEVAEACLAHLTGSAVSRAYQRSDFLDARKNVYAQWCFYVFDCARCAGIKVDSD